MSLLSDTAHTPERIFGLLKLLDALGGEAPRDVVQSIMISRAEEQVAFTQTVGAATSLNLIGTDRTTLRCQVAPTPTTQAEFSDLCYDRILAATDGGRGDAEEDDDNALLLIAYAIVALKCDQLRSLSWFCDHLDVSSFADEVRAAAATANPSGALFNTTKKAPWQRWMVNLGLIEDIGQGSFIPDVTRRLRSEIARAGPQFAVTQPASQFVRWARTRLPFLPGGHLFASVTGQAPRPGECGVLLSAALRNLRDEGIIRLTTVGDAAGQVGLTSDYADPSKSFSEVSFMDRSPA